jgi:hypothetical protein
MTTLRDFKNGATLPAPIYKEKPYVVLAPKNKANAGMVLDADVAENIKTLSEYFDDCVVDIRRYDLYMNDNTRVDGWTLN